MTPQLKVAIDSLKAAWGVFEAAISATAAPAPAPVVDPQHVDQAWPHVITVGGIAMMAKAPINPAWQPSTLAKLVGGVQTGRFVWDPANGDTLTPPLPLRTAAGWPVNYVVVDGEVIGTGSVLYGEQAFNNDAEVASYIARTTTGDPAATKAAWDEVYARIAAQHPAVAATLTPPDGNVPIEQ